ncbi:MAG: heavy-metal-associated domain-containing protein [Sphingobacteriales bacterium]|nr:heavy-metal-associated domain-containing protein [Sphingobacteriales bacterium]
MKTITKLFLITASLFFFSNNIIAQTAYTTTTIKTKIYCDHCSQCESCKSRIEKSVKKLKGVKTVTLDVQNSRIKISFNPTQVSIKSIKDQINKAGYDADDQKATAEYVEQLDGCCKQ